MLLLPLIGGYFFVKNCILTSYEVARESGHRLYFRAAFAGFVLLVTALLAYSTLAAFDSFHTQLGKWLATLSGPVLANDSTPSDLDALAICTVALLLGVFGWRPLNYLLPSEKLLQRAVRDHDVERLLLNALRRGMPVAVTMENRKVYVGFLTTTVDPLQPRRTISLLPMRSGYRDNADGTLRFTTDYHQLFATELDQQEQLKHLNLDDFEIIVPADRVQSISLFDFEAYEAFAREEGRVSEWPGPKAEGDC